MRPPFLTAQFLLLVLLACFSRLPAQQLTYTQDLAFQTVVPTPARAGTYRLFPYGAAHFVAWASELLNPADLAVYDSLGQPTGVHFNFHPDLPMAVPCHFTTDAGGSAYIAGYYTDTTQFPLGKSRIVVAKYLPSGAPDTNWGQGGIWYGDTAIADFYVVRGVKVLASGAVMLADAPIVTGASSPTFFLRRLTPAGQLDTSFGVQGSTWMNPDNRSMMHFYFAEDGSTYADRNSGNTFNAWLARWWADGSLDTTFSIPGAVTDILNVLPDGRIVSHGFTIGGTWGLRRHWSNGTADTTYAAPAVTNTGYNYPFQGGGRIFYHATNGSTPFPISADFTVIRPDGTLDPVYHPAGQPMLMNFPANFWPPASSCHNDAVPGFGNMVALGPQRLIYADFLVATLLTGTFPEYEYYTCPRIISLVTDLQTVGQPEPGTASSPSLWPNPVSDHFSLRIPTRAKAAQVQLYDLAGKALSLPAPTLSAVDGGLQYDFHDLGGLAAGMYVLRISAGGQQYAVKLRKD